MQLTKSGEKGKQLMSRTSGCGCWERQVSSDSEVLYQIETEAWQIKAFKDSESL